MDKTYALPAEEKNRIASSLCADGLNPMQIEQIIRQIEQHDSDEAMDIPLSESVVLENFKVLRDVLPPMSSLFLARYLYGSGICKNKDVIDVGSGSGIQGIAAALSGAKKVILTDKEQIAARNSEMNVSKYDLEGRCEKPRCGDLFENVPEKADLIIFAQPYFPGRPVEGRPVTIGMLDDGGLISKFLEQAKDHLNPGGAVIMIFCLMKNIGMAATANDPDHRSRECGYHAEQVFAQELPASCRQPGDFRVYRLTPLGKGSQI